LLTCNYGYRQVPAALGMYRMATTSSLYSRPDILRGQQCAEAPHAPPTATRFAIPAAS
jgi:hypothetical protein